MLTKSVKQIRIVPETLLMPSVMENYDGKIWKQKNCSFASTETLNYFFSRSVLACVRDLIFSSKKRRDAVRFIQANVICRTYQNQVGTSELYITFMTLKLKEYVNIYYLSIYVHGRSRLVQKIGVKISMT